MQLPDRRKLFQQRRHRREEIEAQLRRAQIESQYSTDDTSSDDTSSEDEESSESEFEEVVNEDESEEEIADEEENEDNGEELVEGEDELGEGEDELEEEEEEDESEEDEVVDEEENNVSFSEKSLTNSSGSQDISLETLKVEIDDSEISVVYDESNETFHDNTPLATNNNVLLNKNNSDDVDDDDDDDDDKPRSFYNSNFNMNDRQSQVVEWMVTRERQKPYGGIIATDMGTVDSKITILMNLLSKSNVPNSDNTQSEGETDLDETIFSKGCTLILCPRSSIGYWKDCIDKKIQPGSLNVWVHYGRNRDISLQGLTQKDIVITTVTLILTGFRDKENNPLYQIKWHRIILDDIKLYNYKQQTSKALCQLSGICHWVFSGPTIIDNDDDEAMYSLIKFINYKPLNIFENWKKWIKVNQTVSMYEKLGHLYYKKNIV